MARMYATTPSLAFVTLILYSTQSVLTPETTYNKGLDQSNPIPSSSRLRMIASLEVSGGVRSDGDS